MADFLTTLPIACWALDRDGRFLHANRAASDYFGGGDLGGKHLVSFARIPEIRERWAEAIRRALSGETVYLTGDDALSADGGGGFLLMTPLRDREAVTGVIGFIVAGPVRMLAKAPGQEPTSSLPLQLRQAPLAVVEWDEQGRVRNWNPIAELVFGYNANETIGKTAQAFLFPDNSPEAYEKTWERVIGQRSLLRAVFESRTKFGRPIVTEWLSFALVDEADRLIGVVSFIQDATERVRSEALLQQTRHLEGLSRIAVGVAHEFNNLLAPMVIAVERLAAHASDPARVIEHLQVLRSALDRARELTARTQLVGGPAPEDREWVDLGALVGSSGETLRHDLDARIHLEITPTRGLPRLFASSSAVVQILTTLLFHARDAFSKTLSNGSPPQARPTITVSTTRFEGIHPAFPASDPRPYQTIVVQDNGPGLEDEAKAHLFEPFFTSRARGSGHGLELPLVWQLTQDHGGWVEVKSERGNGCQIRVVFPELPTPSGYPPADGSLDISRPKLERRASILLVEDNLLVATALSGVLEDRGYDVLCAESGEQAWELLRKNDSRIDLVLSDLHLPGMSGQNFLEKTRREKLLIPVIIISGYVAPNEAKELLQLGVAGLITKPVNPRDLIEAVDRGLAAGSVRPRVGELP